MREHYITYQRWKGRECVAPDIPFQTMAALLDYLHTGEDNGDTFRAVRMVFMDSGEFLFASDQTAYVCAMLAQMASDGEDLLDEGQWVHPLAIIGGYERTLTKDEIAGRIADERYADRREPER